MGLRDRLVATKRLMWSPMTVWMLERGSDLRAEAGQAAKLVVDVEGVDDGSIVLIELFLVLTGAGLADKARWPLGKVPIEIGHHELTPTMPTGLPPSCARFAEYSFEVELHRSKGTGDSAYTPVDVVAREQDLYWPEGPRGDGSGTLALDADVVCEGETLTGSARGASTVELGATIDAPAAVATSNAPQQRERYERFAEAAVDADGRFAIEVPTAVPPTLHNGGTASVVWRVRAGDAWQLVGVRDPEISVGGRVKLASPSLLDLIT